MWVWRGVSARAREARAHGSAGTTVWTWDHWRTHLVLNGFDDAQQLSFRELPAGRAIRRRHGACARARLPASKREARGWSTSRLGHTSVVWTRQRENRRPRVKAAPSAPRSSYEIVLKLVLKCAAPLRTREWRNG